MILNIMSLQKYKIPRQIASGEDGVIFQIAKGLVAKICWTDSKTQHEATVAQRLHQSRISVPLPYGIHPVVFPDKKICGVYANKIYPGFVMEKVEGRTGFQARNLDERIEMFVLRDEELEKVRNIGFVPHDSTHPGNIIFTQDRKIKLIDFCGWQYNSQ